VEEVRVEVRGPGRQLRREDARLAEAAPAVRRRIAADVAEPQPERAPVTRGRAPEGPDVAGQHAARRVVEILGEIGHPRADGRVDRVREGVVGAPERRDVEREPALLEGGELVSDEGLRDARVALEHDDDHGQDARGPRRRGRG
jgi:hypothetical protein